MTPILSIAAIDVTNVTEVTKNETSAEDAKLSIVEKGIYSYN